MIRIGDNGRCQSFEKSFLYYLELVWVSLRSKNFIEEMEMSPDMRIGLYYVMEIYHLGFAVQDWGNFRTYAMKDGESGPALNACEIRKRDLDSQRLYELLDDFENGILPGPDKEQERNRERGEKADLDYGWLSPAGDYTESPFGSHEESAYKICTEKHWQEERVTWGDGEGKTGMSRDFLTEVKGYCLIHNPTGAGGYIVTSVKRLTKQQKEFLYQFFIDKGDRFKAEQYLEE